MKLYLDELERLEREADPLPWRAVIEKENLLTTSCHLYGEDPYMPGLIDIMYYRKPENNCYLIAAMRNALPSLIKRLKAAEEIINAARNFPMYFSDLLERYDEAVNEG